MAFLETLAEALHRTSDPSGALQALRQAVAVDSANRTGKMTTLEWRLLKVRWGRSGLIGACRAFIDIFFARNPTPDGTESSSDR